MARLEQLFIEEKFHPLDLEVPSHEELLKIPLNKELRQKKNKTCNK